MTTLTDRDHTILQLAAARYRHPAQREADALEQLELRPTAFWAAVHRLLDHPAALAAYPADVRRLQRLREARRRHRSGRM